MGSLTDNTLNGLTAIPNAARETPDGALEGDVLVKGYTHNPRASGNLTKASKMLMADVNNPPKGMEGQPEIIIWGLRRLVMDKNIRMG